MTTFPGTVQLEDAALPATLGLGDHKISLVAGDSPIGEWTTGEYSIVDLGSGTFVIEAADDSISFQPDDPGGFAAEIATPAAEETPTEGAVEPEFGPKPKVWTMVAFYVLVALTLTLGIMAALSFPG
jgi:hypothetical protein